MTNYMVKSGSGTGSGRICFTNPAKSGPSQISQKQIRDSPRQYSHTFLWQSHFSATVWTGLKIYRLLIMMTSFLADISDALTLQLLAAYLTFAPHWPTCPIYSGQFESQKHKHCENGNW